MNRAERGRRLWRRSLIATVLMLGGLAAEAAAQAPSPRPWGRVSFFVNTAQVKSDTDPSIGRSDFITSVTFQTADGPGDGLEYGVDVRRSDYTSGSRASRLAIYDGYVGARLMNGNVRVRVGQMWLTDLGGLGAIAGGLAEYHQKPSQPGGLGSFRTGVFFGMEPESYSAGFVHGVNKFGAYAALEGGGGRRHVAGYVRVQDRSFTERSVLTFTNFVPAAHSHVFVYQASEYDLVGPAGQGKGGLTYFMMNARVTASERVELQALYHRGRSIDTRTIADDVINGVAIPAGALDGLLFQSTGGRATVRVSKNIRVNAGYTVDKNNRDSASTGRLTVGIYASNFRKTGFDLNLSESRVTRPTGRYNSLYFSVGHQVGRAVYLSGDYSSSLSIARFTRSDGITIETRPRTRQLSAQGVVTLGRHWSLLFTGERTRDDGSSEMRVMSGLTYRFR
jgi:hypothetical protein